MEVSVDHKDMVDYEVDTIQAVESFSSFLSIIACLFMSRKIINDRAKYNADSSSIRNDIERSKSGMNILAVYFFLNFVLAIFWGIGNSGTINPTFCQVQAFFLQWMMLADVFLAVLMTYQTYQWIVLHKHPKKVDKLMTIYFRCIILASFILAVILLALGVYGDARLWCWVSYDSGSYRVIFFVLVIPSWFVVLFLLRSILQALAARSTNSPIEKIVDLLDSNRRLQNRMIMFVAIFLITWFFAIVNRLVELFLNDSVFALEILTVSTLPLQGFFNTICYGGGIRYIQKFFNKVKAVHLALVPSVFGSQPNAERFSNENGPVEVDASKVSEYLLRESFNCKEYSIFITTLNMGEASLASTESHLHDWILKGHDIYAIGVQECLDIVGLREMILKHLNDGPHDYVLFSTEIGSGTTSLGYHGYIALSIFVRKADFESGRVRATKAHSGCAATGQDLIIAKAQNKGGVGLPLQIHDTSVGFVTCHLPSDSKGLSKLSKRNKSAHAILKELILAEEDLGFDLHLQHDHVFVFGDMNYRMPASDRTLAGVAAASLIEKQALGDRDDFQQFKYNLLRHDSDLQFVSKEDAALIKKAREDANRAWSSVLQDDQLTQIINDGEAFHNFKELMPKFPPSYKRRKGDTEGDCGDYTDPVRTIHGFTNTGTVEEEMVITSREVYQSNSEKKATTSMKAASTDGNASMPSSPVADDARDSISDSVQTISRTRALSSVENRNRRMATLMNLSDDQGTESNSTNVIAKSAAALQDLQESLVNTTRHLMKKHVDPRVLRPPSYTDRILYYSLDDQASRLSVRSYDLCDQLRISDHRAVSMVVNLKVNAAIYNGIDQHPPQGPAFEIYELSVWNICIELTKGIEEAADSDEEDKNSAADPTDNFESSNPLHDGSRPSSGRLSSFSTAANSPPDNKIKKLSGRFSIKSADPSVDDDKFDAEGGSGSFSKTKDRPLRSTHKQPTGFVRRMTRRSVYYTQAIISRLTGGAIEEEDENEEKTDLEEGKTNESNDDDDGNAPVKVTLASDNSLLEGGEWRQRAIEDEKERRRQKQNSNLHAQKIIKTVNKVKKAKKVQKKDRKIHHCSIVFPLPTKDPFLAHKKIYDVEKIYNFDNDNESTIEESVQQQPSGQNHQSNRLNRDELLRPISLFTWTAESQTSPDAPKNDSNLLVREKNTDQPYKLKGCVSKELGAHVLLKFSNKSGYSLGSCVVCLNGLINAGKSGTYATSLTEIPLTSGGQKRGQLSAKFSLRHIPSPLSK